MNNKTCNIIKDLLPSYADGLVTKETEEFVKKHLEECDSCKKIYNNMKNLNLKEETKSNKKIIDFTKKFRRKYNFLKIIVILILFFFIISFIKNAIIITSLVKKADNTLNADNYHLTYYVYDIDTIQKIDYYVINNRYLSKQMTMDKENGKTLGIMTEVYDGETCDIYYENFAELENPEDKKIVLKNVESFIPKYGYQSDIRNEGIIDFVINCAFSDIDTVKCNGRETYRFKNLFRHSSNIMETFIDKDTGLTVRNIGDWIMVGDKEYNKMIEGYIEFNTVTENDLRVQDSDDYTVQN